MSKQLKNRLAQLLRLLSSFPAIIVWKFDTVHMIYNCFWYCIVQPSLYFLFTDMHSRDLFKSICQILLNSEQDHYPMKRKLHIPFLAAELSVKKIFVPEVCAITHEQRKGYVQCNVPC